MKKLLVAVLVTNLSFAFTNAVPLDAPKKPDPYDEDLLKVFKPVVELNGDVSRRRQAVTRLAKIADRLHHLVMALTSALKDPDEVVRLKAAEALADIGPSARDAVPDLVNSLDDANEDVRDWSARALAAIGPPLIYWAATNKYANVERVVAGLTRALKDKSKKVRVAAAKALGYQGPFAKPAVPALIEATREKDAKEGYDRSVCMAAVMALGHIGPDAKQGVPALLEVLRNGDELKVRALAVLALADIAPEDPAVLPVLLATAKQKELRGAAATGLGKVSPKHADKVVPALMKALDVSDVQDREAADFIQYNAIRALEQLGPAAKVALPKIEEILKDRKAGPMARSGAERALKSLRR